MFVDSHCHIDLLSHPQLAIQQAQQEGVGHFVMPAIYQEKWQKLADFAQMPCCHAAYGLHPIFIEKHQKNDIEKLADWIEKNVCVAIGECGLDFTVDTDFQLQRYYFEAQIALAKATSLPLIIHVRKSLEVVLQILKQYKDVRFVIHSFSGSDQQLEQLIDLGGKIGVGGSITYERAQRLRRQVSTIAIDKILLETDSPNMPVFGFQGRENSPKMIMKIAKELAILRGETITQIATNTTYNCALFFQLDC